MLDELICSPSLLVVVMVDQQRREQLRQRPGELGGHGWQRQRLLLPGR